MWTSQNSTKHRTYIRETIQQALLAARRLHGSHKDSSRYPVAIRPATHTAATDDTLMGCDWPFEKALKIPAVGAASGKSGNNAFAMLLEQIFHGPSNGYCADIPAKDAFVTPPSLMVETEDETCCPDQKAWAQGLCCGQ